MSFKEDMPNYKSFPDGELYMHSVPDEVWTSLESFIRKAAHSSEKLKAIINNVAEITGGQLTNNWGWDFLENDISDCVCGIRRKVSGGPIKHFEAFMDSLAILHDIGDLSPEDINEFLEDHSIGYRSKASNRGELQWDVVNDIGIVGDIIDAQEVVRPLSAQAYERFESAKREFENDTNERARKDAVRSCVDSMEALVKELGGAGEIGEATRKLKDEKDEQGNHVWGPVNMVKDGNNIFNLLHELYPDVRHGTQDFNTTEMTMEEAEYFVGRITVFVKYMAARAAKLGRM